MQQFNYYHLLAAKIIVSYMKVCKNRKSHYDNSMNCEKSVEITKKFMLNNFYSHNSIDLKHKFINSSIDSEVIAARLFKCAK